MLKIKSILFSIFAAAILLVVVDSASAEDPPSQPVFVQDYLKQLDFIEGRLLQLEGAMAQDQMSWSPAEDVRSCAQIYLHVAGANYFLASKMGGEMPEGEMDDSITDKDKIADMIKESYKLVKKLAAEVTEEQLNETVQTPFGEMSRRYFMIALLNHMHEHLGQGIAYARMNGVTPPWSEKQKEEEG
jgi:uncharacterized damage-inducible protein DinB